jgi:hypothetical protein
MESSGLRSGQFIKEEGILCLIGYESGGGGVQKRAGVRTEEKNKFSLLEI